LRLFGGAISHAGKPEKPFLGVNSGQILRTKLEYHGDDLRGTKVTDNTSVVLTRWLGAKVRKATPDDDEIMDLNIRSPHFDYALARVGLLPVEGRHFGACGAANYTTDEVKSTVFGVRANPTDNSASFGAGIELLANENSALSLEFTRYVDGVLDRIIFKVEHVAIGYETRF
jgi:hypothetical protein